MCSVDRDRVCTISLQRVLELMDAQFPTTEGVRWSATEWADWIAQQVLVREEIFSKDPDELIAAYRREIGHKRDYHGRELLELLQNADDAGVDYGQASH